MLSEQAKKELLEGGSSQTLREDCERMRRNSLAKDPRSADLDLLMRFLTGASRFAQAPPRPRAGAYLKVFI